MNLKELCINELKDKGIIPRKYHGQVFTTDESVIKKFIQTIKSIYKPNTKIIEIGGGLGYITEALKNSFDSLEVLEIDDDLIQILNKKFEHNKNIKIVKEDILTYPIPKEDYLLVGNIPFHLSGRLYRRFMSEETHKPYGMVFISDKQYAETLQNKPPKSYRVSLQAQVYGTVEIVSDVPPTSVYPEPKVDMCIMKIMKNETPVPPNFWDVVNYHFDNFPTPEVESPKTLGLEDWIKLSQNSKR